MAIRLHAFVNTVTVFAKLPHLALESNIADDLAIADGSELQSLMRSLSLPGGGIFLPTKSMILPSYIHIGRLFNAF